MIEIGRRNFTDANELGLTFYKMFIDTSFPLTCVVLTVINTTTGMRVNEFRYSNFAARTKIVPPIVPAFNEVVVTNLEEFTFAEGRSI